MAVNVLIPLQRADSNESQNVVMSSYDTGLSTINDVKKQKDQSQSLWHQVTV